MFSSFVSRTNHCDFLSSASLKSIHPDLLCKPKANPAGYDTPEHLGNAWNWSIDGHDI